MTLFSVIGGFAARGSQVFEKVEEDMSNLIEKRMENYISRGQARWEAHKAEKKLKRQMAKSLAAYGLDVDQIGVALEQGRGQAVLEYFQKFDGLDETTKQNLGYKGTNIISMGEGYETSGMTMDEMLNTVTGKVSGGMNMTDALTDSVGPSKQNVFAKFLSPDTNKIARKKMQAYETVYGKGTLSKMGQYATGTLEASDLPFTGKINLTTALEEKAIKDTLSTSDMPSNFTAVNNYLKQQVLPFVDGAEIGLGGALNYKTPDMKAKNKAGILQFANNFVATELANLNVPTGQKISLEQQETIRQKLITNLKEYSPSPVTGGDGETTAQIMTKMEAHLRKGVGEYALKPKLTWIKEYKQYLIDIGRASTDTEAGVLANQIYDDLLLRQRDNIANQPKNTKKRSQGGYKGN